MNAIKTGLVAGLFFPSLYPAFATTFGPISVYDQAANSQYYVHAKVNTNAKIALAPGPRRPYTYWQIQVTEQLQGAALPSQFTIREPGGEIGDTGYRLAGTAEFTEGEDVFIALHDTEEEDVKEVVGLASGKFTVEPGKDGKPAVRNGLGMLVSGPDGEALSPDDFGNLLHRIARGAATDADKTIFVSRKTLHDDEVPALSKVATVSRPAPLPPRQPLADTGGVSGDRAAEKPIPTTANAFQQSAPATEEQSTGSVSWGWLIAAGALVGLILGLFLLLR